MPPKSTSSPSSVRGTSPRSSWGRDLDPGNPDDEIGEPVGGIENALPARRRGHRGELAGLGGETGDLAGEAVRREARLVVA